MNETEFAGKRVLVVGGSSGIGNGIARAFSGAGADVRVWGTRPSAEHYSDEPGSVLEGLAYRRVDVADDAAVEAGAAGYESLDVLVLCQGMVLYGRKEFEIDGFRRVVEVNLNSLMACCAAFHDALAAAKGALIVVSSSAAFHATVGNPAYNASKTGAFGLTRTLGQAWARDGIRVNGIAPGLVDTKMTKVTRDNPKRYEQSLERIPAGRWGTPEDMGQVALFLASSAAAYVVGQTIVVDGGLTL